MVLPQPQIKLQDHKGEALVLRVGPARRLVFAAVAVVLLIAFVFTLDPQRDLEGPNLFGTVFYFVLIGGSLAMAAYDERKVFHRIRRELLIQSVIAGVCLRTTRVPFDDIQSITLQTRRLERPVGNTRVGVPDDEDAGGSEEPNITGGKSRVYVLHAVTETGAHTLESSSTGEDLEEVGRSLARFLEVPFAFSER